MKYFKEQGLSYNMRFIIKPGVTVKDIENCLLFFEEEFKNKEKVVIFNMTDWDFIFIHRALDNFMSDKHSKFIEGKLNEEELEVYKHKWQWIEIKCSDKTLIFTQCPEYLPNNI